MAPLRVVFDTNVFISTFILHGRSTRLAQVLFEGKFTLLVSEEILDEYFEVAIRPRFHSTPGEVKELLGRLVPWMHLVHDPRPIRVSRLRDPEDLMFLKCAATGHAQFLVTGDKALLVLRRYRQVPIVSPRRFLQELGING